MAARYAYMTSLPLPVSLSLSWFHVSEGGGPILTDKWSEHAAGQTKEIEWGEGKPAASA